VERGPGRDACTGEGPRAAWRISPKSHRCGVLLPNCPCMEGQECGWPGASTSPFWLPHSPAVMQKPPCGKGPRDWLSCLVWPPKPLGQGEGVTGLEGPAAWVSSVLSRSSRLSTGQDPGGKLEAVLGLLHSLLRPLGLHFCHGRA
jgi:hypothetical protein